MAIVSWSYRFRDVASPNVYTRKINLWLDVPGKSPGTLRLRRICELQLPSVTPSRIAYSLNGQMWDICPWTSAPFTRKLPSRSSAPRHNHNPNLNLNSNPIHRVKRRRRIYGHDTIAIFGVKHGIMCGIEGWRFVVMLIRGKLNQLGVRVRKCLHGH